jgi:signal transduction histidine kinase
MSEQDPTSEPSPAEAARLRQQVEALERKNQECQLLLSMTIEHADALTAGLQNEIQQRRQAESALRATNEALSMHTVQVETIARVGRQITRILDLSALLPQVVDLIQATFDYYSVSIWLADERKETLTLRAFRTRDGSQLASQDRIIPLDTPRGIVLTAYQTGENYLADDVHADPMYRAVEALPDTHSELALPLQVGTQLIGTLDIQSERAAAFGYEDIPALRMLADQIAIAVRNASLYDRITRFNERLEHVVRERTAEIERAYQVTEQAYQALERTNEALERRVAERTALLKEANRELQAFAYSISHDLRAPLRAMGGFARILIDEYAPQLPPQAHDYLHRIQDNVQRMGQLIEDLLAFSRLGQQGIDQKRLEPGKVVQQVLDELHEMQKDRQVEVVIGDLPPCHADPALLKQVYANLLSNALKFTREREAARIEVGCEQQEGEAVYYVRDNGVGFDMRYADKLFGVFQRLHSEQDYEGTGVGLAIVQRIVRRHGGHVWAEAAVDRGATFYFTIQEPEAR